MNKSESEILKDLTDSVDDMRARGANVCLSCFDNCLSAHLPVLYEYEVHPCAVCYYLKRNRLTAGKCPRNKERLKAKLPDSPYAASCWAGVEEWVFPVTSEGRTVMCIHLTGYRGGARATEKSDKLRLLCGEEFGKAYDELATPLPSYETAKRIVTPLIYIAEAFAEKCIGSGSGCGRTDTVFNEALRVMYDRFSEDLTTDEIAGSVGYSASHLRHQFKARGTSVTHALAEIRLRRAAEMLKTTPDTVTEIAGRCGYSDPNYFSVVFSRKFGVSPREYRKNKK